METYVYIIAISSTFNKQRYEYKLTQPCLAQHGTCKCVPKTEVLPA